MATLPVGVPDPFVPRVQAAVGGQRGLKDVNGDPRVATAAEIEREIQLYLHGRVMDWEGQVGRAAVVVPATGLE